MKKNQYIEQFLTEYIELTEPPYFAVLLNGPWGSGKTWFIKDLKEKIDAKFGKGPIDKKGNSSKFLYVSLNGISTFQEIEDLFFEQLHPFLADKKVKIAGKILRGALKATLKVDLNDDGKSDGSVGYSAPNCTHPKKMDSKLS